MCVKSKAANPSENRTPIYLTLYGKLSIKKKTIPQDLATCVKSRNSCDVQHTKIVNANE